MRDSIAAERAGLPAVLIVTEPLLDIASATAEAFRMPDLAIVAVGIRRSPDGDVAVTPTGGPLAGQVAAALFGSA